MGKVMAVNISVKRGTQKVNVHTVKQTENYGLENDAHAGNWAISPRRIFLKEFWTRFTQPDGCGSAVRDASRWLPL